MDLGIHLTLLVGPTVPLPAPPNLAEALSSVRVTHSDQGRSGFQMTFQVGRSGPLDLIDYSLLSLPLLRVFNRVILVVTFGVMPKVLMDGIITNQELQPSSQPGQSTLTVTGEDVSVMMDLEEKSAEHPAQPELIIANKLILSYAQYGLIPLVLPPPSVDVPIPIERIPVQQGTDLQYLNAMASRYGYVFYVAPGPVPAVNTAYFGPPKRIDIPQSALSTNMGPSTNVDQITFRNNALAPTMVKGSVQDRLTNSKVPVQSIAVTRPPLASQPSWLVNMPNVRTTQFRASGLNAMQALSRAQGTMDAASDSVTATGSLDALRYGNILQARGIVGLRGAGFNYDGLYYVKSVTHNIQYGSYQQNFTLTREGVGSTTPVVVP